MSHPIETIEGKYGLVAEIYPDPDCLSPEENYNLGRLVRGEEVAALEVPAVFTTRDGEPLAWALSEEGRAEVEEYGWSEARVLKALGAEANEWSRWANGECYGVNIEGVEGVGEDSCWGFIGLEYAEEEARRMLEDAEEAVTVELDERDYWKGRGVVTMPA